MVEIFPGWGAQPEPCQTILCSVVARVRRQTCAVAQGHGALPEPGRRPRESNGPRAIPAFQHPPAAEIRPHDHRALGM